MLSPRTKIIILITGAVVVIVLIVLSVWDFSPKKETATLPQSQDETEDLSFLEKKDTVTGSEFDASNAEAFIQSYGDGASGESISPLESEARSIAVFFIERFGTYSSDANFANVDDLKTFMTPGMQRWSERYRESQPKSSGFSSLTTEVASLETKTFAPGERRAVFEVVANRGESKAETSESYQQKATIELAQDGSGAWLVDSLYWGGRL